MIFLISFAFTLIIGAILAFMGKPAEMGIAVMAGAIGMAFGNIDKLERFKGAGFEAEMRKATNDAYATTKSLKELAVQSAKATLTLIATEGRYGGGLYQVDKLKLKSDIMLHLKEMSIDPAHIQEVEHSFNRYQLFDHASDVINAICQTDKKYAEALNNKIDYKTLTYPMPQKLREFITTNNIKDQRVEESLKDYEYFHENNCSRKPDMANTD